jgi:hypothetical protein
MNSTISGAMYDEKCSTNSARILKKKSKFYVKNVLEFNFALKNLIDNFAE